MIYRLKKQEKVKKGLQKLYFFCLERLLFCKMAGFGSDIFASGFQLDIRALDRRGLSGGDPAGDPQRRLRGDFHQLRIG
ncbi:MAG TPA: hypothetical protein VGO59_07490 [Verrucomicrobiae bacterium]|jgi:hypothetical protein